MTKDKVPGHNLYAYCGNNPVNLIDPNGRQAQGAIIGAGSLFGPLGLAIGITIALGLTVYTGYKAWQILKAKRDTKQTGDVTKGMTKRQREMYNREIHDYKNQNGMKPNDNLPYWFLKEIADEIKRQYK